MKKLLPILILAVTGHAATAVDFATQVHPVLAARCAPCHSGEKPPAGLSFDTRATAMKGGADGPVIVPGDSAHSLMILRVTHQKGSRMPPIGEPLTEEQIGILRAWIDQGAVWPEAAPATPQGWIAPIAPRDPPLPTGDAAHPIDRFLDAYFAEHGISKPVLVSDAIFARRAYFDLWGLPPSPAQLKAFLNDHAPDKRARLIDSLLANSQMYAENWISWWNDLLRNDMGVNYQGDRKSITPWLIQALEDNLPYDRMISELVNPVAKNDPDGFLIGVNWRGTVNASQTPYMQAAQNTAQVFLGINLKCASCHDSFINRYKLRESYGMAALFSPSGHLELVRCDIRQGTYTTPTLLYPELGSVPEGATPAERRAAAARFFTDPRNGRVPRTLVNRFWQKLLGRGLVEPVDEMDSKPWDPDLLDWMASDFTAHGNDLRYLLREIMTSEAYQMASVPSAAREETPYVFRGPQPRRISAEEFIDTVSAITGVWPTIPADTGEAAVMVRDWQLKASPLALSLGRPLRDQVFTTRDGRATTFQALELVNGETLAKTLRRGALRLTGQLPQPPANLFDSGVMKKGDAEFDVDISGAKQLWLLVQDAGSYDPSKVLAGWADAELTGPKGTVRLADLATLSKFQMESITAEKKPLGKAVTAPLGARLMFPIDGLGFTRLRGRAAVDDGSRPNTIAAAVRFFIFGAEPDMDRLVHVIGKPPVPLPSELTGTDDTINRYFLNLLGREPNAAELRISRQMLGDTTPPQPAALEDFLWSLLLHPEFQYIY